MFTYETNILLHDKLPETLKHVFSGSLNGDNFLIQIWKIYLENKVQSLDKVFQSLCHNGPSEFLEFRIFYPGSVDVIRKWVSCLTVQIDNVGVEGDHVLISVPSHVLLRGCNKSCLSGVDVIFNKSLKFRIFQFMLILEILEAGER